MATSPPFPVHSVLPQSKKRPSIATELFPAQKRRKPSIASATSGGLHPLRQTTFPNETESPKSTPLLPPPPPPAPTILPRGGGTARSPSVDSSVAASGMGRGRKARSEARSVTGRSVRGGAPRTKSVANASVKGGGVGPGGGKSNRGDDGTVRDDEGDEEEEDEEEVDPGADGVEKVDEDQERQKLRILVEAFTPDQSDRYDLYRRVKLPPPVVRRLANQTLSQSVPEAVVKTINGYTKVFIGEIIERAREVQAQWEAAAAASSSSQQQQQSSSSSQTLETTNSQQQPQPQSQQKGTGTNPLGPLLPDHIREALRRYRKDKEGGGAGMRGISSTAMERGRNFSSATGGRRLFR